MNLKFKNFIINKKTVNIYIKNNVSSFLSALKIIDKNLFDFKRNAVLD